MRWVPDPTGRFSERPFFEDTEIDDECEDMIAECLEKRNMPPFTPPLDTDTLSVLLESYASDVDIYADLVEREGAGVEGMTEFRKDMEPRIFIDKRLSEKAAGANRFRSTMAHELFHARFHKVLWGLYWSGLGGNPGCQQRQILFASRTDWYEWQAAYGSGAILVPRSALQNLIGPSNQTPELSQEGQALVARVASTFLVSADAARIRLIQLSYLAQERPFRAPGA